MVFVCAPAPTLAARPCTAGRRCRGQISSRCVVHVLPLRGCGTACVQPAAAHSLCTSFTCVCMLFARTLRLRVVGLALTHAFLLCLLV